MNKKDFEKGIKLIKEYSRFQCMMAKYGYTTEDDCCGNKLVEYIIELMYKSFPNFKRGNTMEFEDTPIEYFCWCCNFGVDAEYYNDKLITMDTVWDILNK